MGVGDVEAAARRRAFASSAPAVRRRPRFVPPAPALSPQTPSRPPPPVQLATADSDCPELDCLRGIISEPILSAARDRALALNVGADRVLMAAGLIEEEPYVHALAASLGLDFEPLDRLRRSECPLPDDRMIEASRTGVLPIGPKGDEALTIVPALAGSRGLIEAARRDPAAGRRLRLTTAARLHRFVAGRAAARIGQIAGDGLPSRHPDLSAGAPGRIWPALAALAMGTTLALLAAPIATILVIEAILAAVFLSWTGLRLASMLSPPLRSGLRLRYSDADLPVYTVIVALYREAAAVPGLIDALEALDYPREKLDLKLALESEDAATIEAVRMMRRRLPCEIVIAPRDGPKTKPKALNAALLLGARRLCRRSTMPRTGPSRISSASPWRPSRMGDERLACVQARLTIDNTADSWLARLFTAEYAGLFDVLLPGMARWRMPLPLGGSSNHFRAQVLRDAGAWDAYNVTEDADLGMRLAGFGYTTQVIPSTTYEEAPARLHPGCGSARAGSRAGSRPGWSICAGPAALLRELGPGQFHRLPACRRRLGAGRAGAWRLRRRPSGRHRHGATDGPFGIAHLRAGLWLSGLCRARDSSACPGADCSQRLDRGADSALLGAACRPPPGARCISSSPTPTAGKRPSTDWRAPRAWRAARATDPVKRTAAADSGSWLTGA